MPSGRNRRDIEPDAVDRVADDDMLPYTRTIVGHEANAAGSMASTSPAAAGMASPSIIPELISAVLP